MYLTSSLLATRSSLTRITRHKELRNLLSRLSRRKTLNLARIIVLNSLRKIIKVTGRSSKNIRISKTGLKSTKSQPTLIKMTLLIKSLSISLKTSSRPSWGTCRSKSSQDLISSSEILPKSDPNFVCLTRTAPRRRKPKKTNSAWPSATVSSCSTTKSTT